MASPAVLARLRNFIENGVRTHIRGDSVYIGHPGIYIRAMNGVLTPAGEAYENMVRETEGAIPESRIFHHNAQPVMNHGVELARDRDGANRVLRRWDPTLNDGRGGWKFTKSGGLYHGRVRFLVEVPVYVNYWDPRRHETRHYEMEDGAPATLEMTDQYLVGHHVLPGDFGVVRNVGTLERQSHFIEAGLRRYFDDEIAKLHRVAHDDDPNVPEGYDTLEPGTGRLMFTSFVQSDRYYTYRPSGQFKISFEGVTSPDHERPTVEVVLGRQLHGKFQLPPEMLWTLDLEETARADFDGKCVAHQLLCVKKRLSHNKDSAAQKVWNNIKEVKVVLHYLQYRCHGGCRDPPVRISDAARHHLEIFLPAWKREHTQKKLFDAMAPRALDDLRSDTVVTQLQRGDYKDISDKSFAEVLRWHFPTLTVAQRYETFFRAFPESFYYRDGYVLGIWDHEPVEESEPAAPFDKGDWPDVGVTSWMIGELGVLMRRTVYVIHNDRKIYTFKPPFPDEKETAIVYNVWGDHFLLYRHAAVGQAAALLRTGPKKDPPLLKLATRHDAEMPRVRWQREFFLAEDNLANMLLLVAFLKSKIKSKKKTRAEIMDETLREIYLARIWKTDTTTKADKDKTSLYETVREFMLVREDALLPYEAHFPANKPLDTVELFEELRDKPLVLWETDLEKLQMELQVNGVSTTASYSAPNKLSALTYRLTQKKRIVVFKEPADALILNNFCHLASLELMTDIPYHGESKGVVLLNVLNAMLTAKRRTIGDRLGIAAAYENKCADCGQALHGKFELHHVKAVRDGGENDLGNLKPLCAACHLEYTREREEQGKTAPKPMVSRLTPYMAEEFRRTPKPKVWHWGLGAGTDAMCLDLVGCRRSALLYGQEDYPIFTPADDPEIGGYNAKYDFFYIKRREDLPELDGLAAMLYDGAHWYPRVSTRYMLREKIVSPACVVRRIKASRRLTSESLRKADALVEAVYEKLRQGPDELPCDDRISPRCRKEMWNAFLGVCSTNPRLTWSAVQSTCLDDMGHRIDVLTTTKGGIPIGHASTEIVGVETLYPLALHALHWESVAMHRTVVCLRDHGVKIIGWQTDGVFFRPVKKRKASDKEETPDVIQDAMRCEHAPVKPIYQLKTVPQQLVPRCPQTYIQQDRELGATKPWTTILETDPELKEKVEAARFSDWLFRKLPIPFEPGIHDTISQFVDEGFFSAEARSREVPKMLADIIVHNGGAMVTGGPGVGKTVLERKIIDEWRLRYPKQRVITTAQTHAASRLMPNGKTLAGVLNKEIHGKIAGALVIVDEASMVGLGAWSVLAEWKLLGAAFVVLGDFEGQFLPIADSYDANIRVDRLDIMRQIANSLHVRLTVPKRFEQAHFDWVMSKYPLVERPFTDAHAAEVRGRFPWRGEQIDLYIAICHRHRRMFNALANQRDRAGVLVACVPAKGANLPQEMFVRPGMRLLGCSKSCARIVNGVPYDVIEATDAFVRVRMVPDYKRDFSLSTKTGDALVKEKLATATLEGELTLGHDEVSRLLRLPYSVTYRNAQGLTARDKRVMITSLEMPQFDIRSLIVGTSRVTRGDLLYAPTKDQERRLLESCPNVPDPPDEDVEESEEEPDYDEE